MPTREILMSHPVSTLRAEIAKANLSQKADKNLFKRAVSKMRKEELIAVMMAPAYKDRFHHIKMNEKGAGKPKKQPRFPAVEKEKEKKAKEKEKAKVKMVKLSPPKEGQKPKKSRAPPKPKPKEQKSKITKYLKPEAKSKKRPEIKLVSFDPKLTATKADGTVLEVKKRERSKK